MAAVRLVAVLCGFGTANAYALDIFRGYVARRSSGPASLSGITYAGGNVYYAVADKGAAAGLYKMTVSLSDDGRTVTSYGVGPQIVLEGANDLEGVAYDPGSGNVWAADEGNQTIAEFDPKTGERLREVSVPAVMKGIRPDYGFESLTISGDGLTMWTANEEALPCDGPNSSYSAPTTVRLVRFDRPHVDGDWSLTSMYAYTTDKWHLPYGYGSAGLRGVSDLCALPDGSLVVMERELSTSEYGTGFWAGLSVKLYFSLYLVTPQDFASATDIQANPGLAANGGWVPVGKTLLYGHNPTGSEDWLNMEGICLGQRPANGNGELLALTDAGDGYTYARMLPIAFSGLNIRSLSFARPELGLSSISGSNFRYLDGTRLNVSLSGMSPPIGPYETDGTERLICDGWSLVNGLPMSGTGTVASFMVDGDVEFAWNVRSETVKSGYLAVDTFEELPLGMLSDGISGWCDDGGAVVEETYVPPLPPGNVLTNVTHARVLCVEDRATRTVTSGDGRFRIEQMVCMRRPDGEGLAACDNAQLAVSADGDGHMTLWHLYEDGGQWKRGWTQLSQTKYEDGEWIRLSVEFDYTSNSDGHALARVKANGSCMPTSRGVRSPTDNTSYGAWYYVAVDRTADRVPRVSRVTFAETRTDDIVTGKPSVVPEETGDSSSDGIDFRWFDSYGLPRDAGAPAPFIAGYTLADVYTAGVNPFSEIPLQITEVCMGDSRHLRLVFNGYKGDAPGDGYEVQASDAPDFEPCQTLDETKGDFTGDAAGWSTVWNGVAPADPDGPCFYRVRARR